MAGLEVSIGADKSDFEKKIKEVELDIKELSKEKAVQIKLGLDTSEISANIKDAKKYLSDLKTTAKDTGNSFSKDLAPKVANGGNALMQFSRIAQDAPFGIMGIGNNITATAESFGYLIKETGSAGGALKAVASSIMGTGGILLAVSLVTTGLTYMSQNGITVGDVFNKLSGTFDETAKSMSDISKEAVKNSAGEIASMGAYVSVAKNVNLSMSDRLIAVQKLQEEYPAYFGNLSNEAILNGNVAGAVKGVTIALIAKAKAAAIVDRIVKLSEEEAKIQEEIGKSIAGVSKFYQLSKTQEAEVTKILNKQLRGEIDLVGELNAGRAQSLSKTEKTALAAYQYSATLRDLGDDLRDNISQQDKYTKSLNESVAAQIKLEAKTPKIPKKKKIYDTPQVIGIKSELDSSGLAETAGNVMQIAKNVQGAEGVIATSMGNIRAEFNMSGVALMETMHKFSESANKLIAGAITDTFTNLGTMLGNSLAGADGGLEDAGKNILGIIGSFMTEFGKLMIETGVGLVIAKKMLSSGNGYAMIAGGIALVAIGSAFASKSKATQKSGSDSLGGRSSSTGASYNSPASTSTYATSGSGYGGGSVIFEISGTSLLGVLNNTMDRNKRLGGS